MDVREPVVAALVADDEPGMVYTEQVERGGIEVMDMHRVLDDVVGVIVGVGLDVTLGVGVGVKLRSSQIICNLQVPSHSE